MSGRAGSGLTAEQGALLAAIHADIGRIRAVLGHESEDGGGTGLVGRVARIEARMGAIETLRDRAIGAAAAVALFGTLILLGVKALVLGEGGGA